MKLLRVCVAVVVAVGLFMWVGCNDSSSPSSPSASLTYLGWVGGVCESGALEKVRGSKETPVNICTTGDTVSVIVDVPYNCGTPFETSCDITNGVVRITIKDACPDGESCYQRCSCSYPFEFRFKKTGAVNYDYTVELVSPLDGKSGVLSSGKLTAN